MTIEKAAVLIPSIAIVFCLAAAVASWAVGQPWAVALDVALIIVNLGSMFFWKRAARRIDNDR